MASGAPSTPPAAQRPSAGARRAVELGAAVGAARGAAGAAQGAQAAVGAAGSAAVVAAGIVAGMISFLARLREANRAWLTRELGRHSKVPEDIASTVQAEMQLEQVFAQRSADRLAKGLPVALAIADPARREARVRQLLADEERYARQRQEAMAARAIAALTRHALRRESPLGAFWRLGLAHKHTEGCKFLAGKFWPWPVLDRVHPPRHYGCFPGDVRVAAAGVRCVTRRWYEGELVRVRTADGKLLAITPNHPVLTRRGWVAADILQEGDQVVRSVAGNSIASLDDEHVPASFAETFDAVGVGGVPLTVPSATVDFYGERADHEVDVVAPAGDLRYGFVAAHGEQRAEVDLVLPDGVRIPSESLKRQRAFGEFARLDASPASGRVGSHSHAATFLGRARGSGQLGLLAPAAHPDSGESQACRDGATSHAVALSDRFDAESLFVFGNESRDIQHRDALRALCAVGLDARFAEPVIEGTASLPDAEPCLETGHRFASQVALDEIVCVDRFAFRGHVFDLDSGKGWLLANGIVVSNCTSSLHGFGEAIQNGWMSPGDVQDPGSAIRAAMGVVMEAEEGEGLLRELALRDRLVDAGVHESSLRAVRFEGARW